VSAPPDPPPAPAPEPPNGGDAAAPPGAADGARRLGEGITERPIPRGCHPLVFGLVMGTLQFGCTVYFMRTC
jgi:hypothetical protein